MYTHTLTHPPPHTLVHTDKHSHKCTHTHYICRSIKLALCIYYCMSISTYLKSQKSTIFNASVTIGTQNHENIYSIRVEMHTIYINHLGCMVYKPLDYSCDKFYNLIGQHWDYKLLRTPLLRTPTSMHVK